MHRIQLPVRQRAGSTQRIGSPIISWIRALRDMTFFSDTRPQRCYKVVGSAHCPSIPTGRNGRRDAAHRTRSTNGTRARETIVTPSTGKWIHLTNLFAYGRPGPAPAAGPHYSKLAAEVCPICYNPRISPSSNSARDPSARPRHA